MAAAMDVRLALGNLPLDCTIRWKNPRDVAATPFSCATDHPIDSSQLRLEVIEPIPHLEPEPKKQ
jgi:hypothetical protein